jgi:hypothetical protein
MSCGLGSACCLACRIRIEMPEHSRFWELTYGIVCQDPTTNLLRSRTRWLTRVAQNSNTLRCQLCAQEQYQTRKDRSVQPHLSNHLSEPQIPLVGVRDKLYPADLNLPAKKWKVRSDFISGSCSIVDQPEIVRSKLSSSLALIANVLVELLISNEICASSEGWHDQWEQVPPG